MVRRVSEEQLTALCTLEIEVRWVFPREADTAVNLDVLGRSMEIRL